MIESRDKKLRANHEKEFWQNRQTTSRLPLMSRGLPRRNGASRLLKMRAPSAGTTHPIGSL